MRTEGGQGGTYRAGAVSVIPRRNRQANPKHVPRACSCHPVCLGHHYASSTLVCMHIGCNRSWWEEQREPSECRGRKVGPEAAQQREDGA